MDLTPILKSQFTWGLLVGLFFVGMTLWSHFKTRMEFRRYKKLLGDKMELESDQYRKIKEERERLGQENENLRLKVGSSKENPARELERELEIFARAEKRMMINAPGFAGAWEAAKAASHDELVQEERGKSLPKKIFRKFFRGEGSPVVDMPVLETKSGGNGSRDQGGSAA
ncbi:MAG: hypothetical protein ABL994_23950 [Verrucomicrobiales bacterium]